MFVNFLTALSGILLLALAIFGMTAQARTSAFYSTNVPTYILVLAIVILATSVIGFIGTSQDHPAALKTYLALVVLVFVLQVILGSVALARESDVGPMAYDAWEDAYLHNPSHIEKIERTFQCCGYSSLLDRPVPDDCALSKNFGFGEPCRGKLVDAGSRVLHWLGVTLLIIASLEVSI